MIKRNFILIATLFIGYYLNNAKVAKKLEILGRNGNKKKKGIYPRHPIFVNLKSNTMKNTMQR